MREDSLTLYGFATDDERDIFETGADRLRCRAAARPGHALGAGARPAARGASTGADLATLTKVPGIGKKGAERIVLELRDKIGVPSGAAGTTAAAPAGRGAAAWRDQVTEALVGLGYSAKQAEDAVDAVAADGRRPTPTSPAMLRAALRELGR